MTAGLPGTGISGFYYLLLVLWMPFHELREIIMGRGPVGQWRVVLRHSSIAAGILTTLVGEAWLLKALFYWIALHTMRGAYWHVLFVRSMTSLVPTAATWITCGILGGVVITTHLLRLCLVLMSVRDGSSAPIPAARPLRPQVRTPSHMI